MPDGQGHGFLWRLNAYWRLEQQPDGVFAECHTLSLSRDVPSGLGWIIRPIIRDLPRQSLIDTLKATARASSESALPKRALAKHVLASRDQRELVEIPKRQRGRILDNNAARQDQRMRPSRTICDGVVLHRREFRSGGRRELQLAIVLQDK